MQILDGKLVAAKRREALAPKVAEFIKTAHRAPQLVVVLIGENPASQVYVRNKVKACASVGILSQTRLLPSSASQAQLMSLLVELNQDPTVDGILVQLPLPKGLDESQVNKVIDPYKDVDGLSFASLGHLWSGHPLVAPCTPQGVMTLLARYQIAIAGKKAVVVGRSTIVGKPMAHLLSSANATVTLCHSQTVDLRSYTSAADLVVVAAGRPLFLGRQDFRQGAVVVDVGIHGSGSSGGKICGDVRFDELAGWAAAATPVPGGVGPMTIATLLENTLVLAKLRMELVKKTGGAN